MKKFFASLLALVGMVAGLTLTSCGGGGGGSENLSGIEMIVNGSVSTYRISLVSKISGDSYEAFISDFANTRISSMVMTVLESKKADGDDDEDGDFTYLKGMVSPGALDVNDNQAFYQILTGVNSANDSMSELSFIEPMVFEYDAAAKTVKWTGEISFKAIANNVTQEAEVVVNRVDSVVYFGKYAGL